MADQIQGSNSNPFAAPAAAEGRKGSLSTAMA